MQQLVENSVPEKAPIDFLPLNGTDFLEFYVGNAKQAAYFYRAAFGMKLVAYRGPETGMRDRVSYVLQQGKIRFVLTTPLFPDNPIADHIRKHGDGVHEIALWVDDAEAAYNETTKRGARGVQEPTVREDEDGRIRISVIAAYGDTLHAFVERKDYRDVMGFQLYQHFDDKDISTEYSALMSKVMSNGNGRVKFPINEPAVGKKKSQIEEYLEFYGGPGVQHIAMATGNIIETVSKMRAQGIEFLRVPSTYYDDLEKRSGKIDEPVSELADLGILVDRDDEGYMLQIFTKPVEDRPTLFFEIIQRKGSRSFGKGNFKALFEAIEREQASRGNL